MHCPHCRAEVKDGWKFCPKCGRPLPDAEGNMPEHISPPANSQHESKSSNNAVILGIVLILAAVLFFWLSSDSMPSQKATIPATSIGTKDLSKMLDIQDGWVWEGDRYGYAYIRGSVKNIGDKPVTYFAITAEYLDDNGQVLDSTYTNSLEKIYPGNQKRFEIMHRHSQEFKKARIFVSKVRADNLP